MKVTDILKDGEIKQLEIRARNSWLTLPVGKRRNRVAKHLVEYQ
jgi:hypothetical protein